ncbi:MAG: hypothetical protein M0R17_08495 [Candidatus Omnitrophica bacterium]|jgi:hypothetical protein|nr:hypothetical protein [Candidatus Omnitrophota bacterium]
MKTLSDYINQIFGRDIKVDELSYSQMLCVLIKIVDDVTLKNPILKKDDIVHSIKYDRAINDVLIGVGYAHQWWHLQLGHDDIGEIIFKSPLCGFSTYDETLAVITICGKPFIKKIYLNTLYFPMKAKSNIMFV